MKEKQNTTTIGEIFGAETHIPINVARQRLSIDDFRKFSEEKGYDLFDVSEIMPLPKELEGLYWVSETEESMSRGVMVMGVSSDEHRSVWIIERYTEKFNIYFPENNFTES